MGTYAAELKAGTLTVNEALTALQKRLESAYAEALTVIDQQPPENRFIRVSVGDPPWMKVAREQMARGVAEDPGDRNAEEIAAYFKDINAHVGTFAGQTVHWCGAFVGYCIKNCGGPLPRPRSPQRLLVPISGLRGVTRRRAHLRLDRSSFFRASTSASWPRARRTRS